jgi:hypothetical protein
MRKYVITAPDYKTSVCDHELPHFIRFNNLRDDQVMVNSYCGETNTLYASVNVAGANKYKSSRTLVKTR